MLWSLMKDSKKEVSIRPATEEDLDRIEEIEKRVYSFAGAVPWTRKNFHDEFRKEHSQFWVLTDDETDAVIVGYLVFSLMFFEMEILNLVVNNEFRGLGHGADLIRKGLDFARQNQARKAFLEVRKSNQAAIQLYQKIGFDITRVRKELYSNGEDAYYMELILQGQDDPGIPGFFHS